MARGGWLIFSLLFRKVLIVSCMCTYLCMPEGLVVLCTYFDLRVYRLWGDMTVLYTVHMLVCCWCCCWWWWFSVFFTVHIYHYHYYFIVIYLLIRVSFIKTPFYPFLLLPSLPPPSYLFLTTHSLLFSPILSLPTPSSLFLTPSTPSSPFTNPLSAPPPQTRRRESNARLTIESCTVSITTSVGLRKWR